MDDRQVRLWRLGGDTVMQVAIPPRLTKKNIEKLRRYVEVLASEAAISWEDDPPSLPIAPPQDGPRLDVKACGDGIAYPGLEGRMPTWQEEQAIDEAMRAAPPQDDPGALGTCREHMSSFLPPCSEPHARTHACVGWRPAAPPGDLGPEDISPEPQDLGPLADLLLASPDADSVDHLLDAAPPGDGTDLVTCPGRPEPHQRGYLCGSDAREASPGDEPEGKENEHG